MGDAFSVTCTSTNTSDSVVINNLLVSPDVACCVCKESLVTVLIMAGTEQLH